MAASNRDWLVTGKMDLHNFLNPLYMIESRVGVVCDFVERLHNYICASYERVNTSSRKKLTKKARRQAVIQSDPRNAHRLQQPQKPNEQQHAARRRWRCWYCSRSLLLSLTELLDRTIILWRGSFYDSHIRHGRLERKNASRKGIDRNDRRQRADE